MKKTIIITTIILILIVPMVWQPLKMLYWTYKAETKVFWCEITGGNVHWFGSYWVYCSYEE